MRMAIMGRQERLTAARMYELGVITEVVAPDALGDRLKELAEMVNRNAPLAVRGTRLAIRKGLGIPLYEAELLAEAYRERVLHTEDSKEGPRAFMEKREPQWRAE
jgi:enoyl-CoA hydratase/carnithine racemase